MPFYLPCHLPRSPWPSSLLGSFPIFSYFKTQFTCRLLWGVCQGSLQFLMLPAQWFLPWTLAPSTPPPPPRQLTEGKDGSCHLPIPRVGLARDVRSRSNLK